MARQKSMNVSSSFFFHSVYVWLCVFAYMWVFFYKLSSFIVTWLEFISSSMVFQHLVFIFHFCMFFPFSVCFFYFLHPSLTYFVSTFSFLLLSFVSRVVHALMKENVPFFSSFVAEYTASSVRRMKKKFLRPWIM